MMEEESANPKPNPKPKFTSKAEAEAALDRIFKPVAQFHERYTMSDVLGSGHFAQVRKCIDKATGTTFAVKIIQRKDLLKSLNAVRSEVEVLKAVGSHQYIVSLVDTYASPNQFYLVLEYCAGGDLFSQIVAKGHYSEAEAARACRQLAEALKYVHSKGVVHRDLKPENVLLDVTKSGKSRLKVADFGLSKLLRREDTYMRTICGTWAYTAIEVIERKPYTPAVDVWTLGILTFILCSGYHPFDNFGDMPEPELLKKICSCQYDFDDPVWDEVSADAKDLIQHVLVRDVDKRYTLDQYLNSAWIRSAPSTPLSQALENLAQYNAARKKFRGIVAAKVAAKRFKNSISLSSKRAATLSKSVKDMGRTLSKSAHEELAER